MRTSPRQNSSRRTDAIFSLLHLDCSSSSEIERKLRKVSGIKKVTVDFVANTVLISYDPDQITTQDIRNFIAKTA